MLQLKISYSSRQNFVLKLLSILQDEPSFFLYGNLLKDSAFDVEQFVAIGSSEVVSGNSTKQDSFSVVSNFQKEHPFICGYFGYDLKNEVEGIQSKNEDRIGMPDFCFFTPELLINQIGNNDALLNFEDEAKANAFQAKFNVADEFDVKNQNIDLRSRISKTEYLRDVVDLKNHIQRGDIYEVNYCQEYLAKDKNLDVDSFYYKMLSQFGGPFSSFMKHENKVSVYGSPERFISKKSNRVISQPIKGTIKRGRDQEEDETNLAALKSSLKDKTENVMIVDLVRNDLSHIANDGSVKVDELFGVYQFPHWYQMISTISCEVENVDSVDIVKSCFPMGSMTGAPKVSAMELIDTFEHHKRGTFSSAFGFMTGEGDFDFNVSIRGLAYDGESGNISVSVGGAITNASNPEGEYEECMTKVSGIFDIFNQSPKG